jgi:hypothetical protein
MLPRPHGGRWAASATPDSFNGWTYPVDSRVSILVYGPQKSTLYTIFDAKS